LHSLIPRYSEITEVPTVLSLLLSPPHFTSPLSDNPLEYRLPPAQPAMPHPHSSHRRAILTKQPPAPHYHQSRQPPPRGGTETPARTHPPPHGSPEGFPQRPPPLGPTPSTRASRPPPPPSQPHTRAAPITRVLVVVCLVPRTERDSWPPFSSTFFVAFSSLGLCVVEMPPPTILASIFFFLSVFFLI